MKLGRSLMWIVAVLFGAAIFFIATQMGESPAQTAETSSSFTRIGKGKQGDDPLYSEEIARNSALTLNMQDQLASLDSKVDIEIRELQQQSRQQADKNLDEISRLKLEIQRLLKQADDVESGQDLVGQVKDSMSTELKQLAESIATLQQAVSDTAQNSAKQIQQLQQHVDQQLADKTNELDTANSLDLGTLPTVASNESPENMVKSNSLITKPYGSLRTTTQPTATSNPLNGLSSFVDKTTANLGLSPISLDGKPVSNTNNTTQVTANSTTVQTSKQKEWPTVFPVYTLPSNTIMSDANLITPLIGSVPNITGSVTDPYFFKVEIGAANLAANGHTIPGVAKMIASGYATGVREQSCARGYINSLTFIFIDGRIVEQGKPAQAGDSNGQALGYIADPWGKPCITGEYVNNSGDYLMSRGAASFLEAAAQGLAQGQISYESDANGTRQAFLDGNMWSFVLGQGVSGSAAEIASYIRDRALNAVDIVYVPQNRPVQIFLNEMIEIDYDSKARVVNYYAEPSATSMYD